MANKNPKTTHLKPYNYKTDRKEACTAQVSVRIAPSVKEKLQEVEGWQEEVRKLLDKIVAPKSA